MYLTESSDALDFLLVNGYRNLAADFVGSLENEAKRFMKMFQLKDPGRLIEWADLKAVPNFMVREARDEDLGNLDDATESHDSHDHFERLSDSEIDQDY